MEKEYIDKKIITVKNPVEINITKNLIYGAIGREANPLSPESWETQCNQAKVNL